MLRRDKVEQGTSDQKTRSWRTRSVGKIGERREGPELMRRRQTQDSNTGIVAVCLQPCPFPLGYPPHICVCDAKKIMMDASPKPKWENKRMGGWENAESGTDGAGA
ncbi:uncharacterized protein SPSK_10040 [Sporothrix schenckii 1099-18]|uniref:Uncharacterized protein n=1 Tax=Sporothrix schenckii 1099-18 TaxID=1397361 RepID=A0A0F2M5K0_SPOSC|nr:uncharacterized protein SPSK_10040 [Sporothrix schenckii 1099-18]KJR84389.1 hypothetical protein SPSK_10040 [Sporothrix schenckii 1099-18]